MALYLDGRRFRLRRRYDGHDLRDWRLVDVMIRYVVFWRGTSVVDVPLQKNAKSFRKNASRMRCYYENGQ